MLNSVILGIYKSRLSLSMHEGRIHIGAVNNNIFFIYFSNVWDGAYLEPKKVIVT